MLKAGLIGAGIGFVVTLVAAVITPCCNPPVAILLGLGVGVLAAVWERPATSGDSAIEGAKAGAIATAGALIGQMIGAVVNGLVVGPDRIRDIYRQFDIQMPLTPARYWVSNLGGNCFCAVIDIALGAALGALGGVIWYQFSGKNKPPTSPLEERR